jgi:hypothetical protein
MPPSTNPTRLVARNRLGGSLGAPAAGAFWVGGCRVCFQFQGGGGVRGGEEGNASGAGASRGEQLPSQRTSARTSTANTVEQGGRQRRTRLVNTELGEK